MPTSPSPRPGAKSASRAAPPARARWPRLVLLAALTVLGIACAALPASVIAHILPGGIRAEDFSGSVWHGSAGRITANGRPAGALEWRLHPWPLLRLHLAADLHWVKGGFVLDGALDATTQRLVASDVQGGGPIGDLRDFGVAAGWRGTAGVRIKQFSADISTAAATVTSAVGDITLADVGAPQLASGADLGGYSLSFDDAVLAPDAPLTAALADTSGPLIVNATLTLSAKTRSGLLSGTIKERADVPAALRAQLENLAQFRPRDAQGRIPVDLEFTF